MMDPVFVGECPGARVTNGVPLDPAIVGTTGRNLANLCGMESEEFLRRTGRVNLFPEWTRGTWYPERAEASATQLRKSGLLRGRAVVLMGQKVWAAFGFPDVTPLTMACIDPEIAYYYLPHPSGLNRWYNDAANREAAERLLRSLFS